MSSVDLPEPDGPSSPTTSPAAMSRSTPGQRDDVVALQPVDVHQSVRRDVEPAHRVPSRIRSTVPPLSCPAATAVARAHSTAATASIVQPPTARSGAALTRDVLRRRVEQRQHRQHQPSGEAGGGRPGDQGHPDAGEVLDEQPAPHHAPRDTDRAQRRRLGRALTASHERRDEHRAGGDQQGDPTADQEQHQREHGTVLGQHRLAVGRRGAPGDRHAALAERRDQGSFGRRVVPVQPHLQVSVAAAAGGAQRQLQVDQGTGPPEPGHERHRPGLGRSQQPAVRTDALDDAGGARGVRPDEGGQGVRRVAAHDPGRNATRCAERDGEVAAGGELDEGRPEVGDAGTPRVRLVEGRGQRRDVAGGAGRDRGDRQVGGGRRDVPARVRQRQPDEPAAACAPLGDVGPVRVRPALQVAEGQLQPTTCRPRRCPPRCPRAAARP